MFKLLDLSSASTVNDVLSLKDFRINEWFCDIDYVVHAVLNLNIIRLKYFLNVTDLLWTWKWWIRKLTSTFLKLHFLLNYKWLILMNNWSSPNYNLKRLRYRPTCKCLRMRFKCCIECRLNWLKYNWTYQEYSKSARSLHCLNF